MPLLRKQPFAKQKPPPDLDENEEIFYCPITGEIFRDYEQFFERIILCNSLVWSCRITGKSGLTYSEALDSEKQAQKQLSSFSENLQKPILFLALLTHRSRINDLNDDIFTFTRDRYFIGETVEVVHKQERKTCTVKKVILPTKTALNGVSKNDVVDLTLDSEDGSSVDEVILLDGDSNPNLNKSKGERIDALQYQYIVCDNRKGFTFTAHAETVSRKKGVLTRDKLKLYLKNHCDPSGNGIWKLKEKSSKRNKLAQLEWNDIFVGPVPVFEISESKQINRKSIDQIPKISGLEGKKAKKEKEKKQKELKRAAETAQDHISKIIEMTASMPPESEPSLPNNQGLTLEQRNELREKLRMEKMKIREEEKAKRKEERDKERLRLREQKREKEEFYKEWNQIRDDLQCDDLKDLPAPTPVNCELPANIFGDVMLLYEFITAFKPIFEDEECYPGNLSLGALIRGLSDTSVNSKFTDLVQFMLTTIFSLQNEEESDELDDSITEAKDMPDTYGNIETRQEIHNSSASLRSLHNNFGVSLSELELNPYTMTEMLRQHFACAGAETSSANVKSRYQQRGIYYPSDDPAFEFRLAERDLMEVLSRKNVFDLSPADKLKILKALVNEIITYVTSRDFIEENCDKLRHNRHLLRHHQFDMARRDKEESSFWYHKRMEERAKEKELKKKAKEASLLNEEKDSSAPSPMEVDNVLEEPDEKDQEPVKNPTRQSARHGGVEPTKQKEIDVPESGPIDWGKLTEEERSAIKERQREREEELMESLVEYSSGCCIAPLGRDRTFRRFWTFKTLPGLFVEDCELHVSSEYFTPIEQVNSHNLSNSSNKENQSNNTPATTTNCSTIPSNALSDTSNRQITHTSPAKMITQSSDDSVDSLTFLSVHDQIKQLGQNAWSFYHTPEQLDSLINALNARGVRESSLKQALTERKHLIMNRLDDVPMNILLSKETQESNKKQSNNRSESSVVNDSAEEVLELNLRESLLDLEERIYVGMLGALRIEDRIKWQTAIENGGFDAQTQVFLSHKSDQPLPSFSLSSETTPKTPNQESSNHSTHYVVANLAVALLQISQGIEQKYLLPPFGNCVLTRRRGKKQEEEKPIKLIDGKTPRQRWEESLVSSSSLPQIFLHLSILDKLIAWSKSSLNAYCRICRRKGDGEHMLLCDGCDRGHHMYCLNPPVKSIPRGDWFCSDCKPKQLKTPRKQRRPTVEMDSDSESSSSTNESDEESGIEAHNESDDSNDQEEESDEGETSDEESEESGDEEASDSSSDDESEDESQTVQQVKLKFGGQPKGLKKVQSATSSGRSTPTNVNKKPKSQPNSLTRGQSNGRTGLKRTQSMEFKAASSRECTPPAPKKSTSKSRASVENPLLKQLQLIVNELWECDESWPFLKAVTKRDAPDYFQIIKKPMDLCQIKNRLQRKEYNSHADAIADIRLMFNNCSQYNMPDADQYKAGKKLSKLFEKRISEHSLNTPNGRKAPRRTR